MNVNNGFQPEYESFLAEYPSFKETFYLDELRADDYPLLDAQEHIYLDYTGASLFSLSQIHKHTDILKSKIYGNPHSINPSSLASTEVVKKSRQAVLNYFNASTDEYTVIFTPNATGSIKIVAESYPFSSGSQLLLTFDNHNSVNGVREFAHSKNASVRYVPIVPPDLRIDTNRLIDYLDDLKRNSHGLFIYPAQSNFSGVQYPLEWVLEAHKRGWDVMLDSAAFVPTNRLDLSKYHPDFAPISFYKMFGYPTGIGCLIARKEALRKLTRPWFSGGTITISSVLGEKHYLADEEAGFEDGTVNYLNMPAVGIGLNHIKEVGIETIHERVICLTGWLLKTLTSLRHKNNMPLLCIYGPLDLNMRGGTIAFNFCDPKGQIIEFCNVEKLAIEANISLRTGCFCNPGVNETIYGLTEREIESCFGSSERMTFEQYLTIIKQKYRKNMGAIRISLGLVSNFSDIWKFKQFAGQFLNKLAKEF